jgi:hypothetical protein
MSKGKRIAICVAVAVVTVPLMVFILRSTMGQTSNAIVGGVGAVAVLVTWFLTAPGQRG